MSIDQQLGKLKGHVLIFSKEFRDLIESFEMLVPVAENRQLLKSLSEGKRKLGVGIIRWSLVQICIIGITKLAYDAESQNPTVGNLIGAIINPSAQALRDKLKDAFSIPIEPAAVARNIPSPEESAALEEIARIDAKELRLTFDRYLSELEEQWRWFSEQKQAFKDLRDRRFAHIDVGLIDREYQLPEIEPPTWRTIKGAVERLILVAEILLTIVHQKDESFEQAVSIARKAAVDFWEP
jgi:hypothetical protein